MKLFPAAVAEHLFNREGLKVQVLVWLKARDRDTGAIETIGFWTGEDHKQVVIKGDLRTYYGVGSLLTLEPFVSQAQGKEQSWTFQVSSLHEQVVEAVRIYDLRLAPVEAHSWFFNADTNQPIAEPVREFRGTVTELDLPTPPIDGESNATVTCVSDAWRLTRGLTLKRSDAALKSRTGGADLFRQYNAPSGAVQTAWGEWVKDAEAAARDNKKYDIDVHMGGER